MVADSVKHHEYKKNLLDAGLAENNNLFETDPCSKDLNLKKPETDKVLKLEIGKVSLPDIDFEAYEPGLRKNVLIHILFDNKPTDPKGSDAALIRYLPDAYVPRHLHMGFEMVFVLSHL
jgi:hypothetical protein